jgi:hypothetical protein
VVVVRSFARFGLDVLGSSLRMDRRALLLVISMLSAGCASSTTIRSQKTPDFRLSSYRTISLGRGRPGPPFERRPLSPELEAKAWEIMQGPLVSKRWRFVDVRGTDLFAYWGVGRATGDRGVAIDDETLVLDVFDRRTGRRVWYAFALDVAPVSEDDLTDLVGRMLLGFPDAPPRPRGF